ncbi:4a-hydroxytetrahydrobiopterin dehydratase [Corynebacterium tapiri]|nr:4a-hydroxytetrahydrobiopterin dehydratase [Corynebacterium tapiri]
MTAEDLGAFEEVDGLLVADFETTDFNQGVKFVVAIGEAADKADHHPDVLLAYNSVTVTLKSHDVDAITSRDHRMARTITELHSAL